MWGKDGKIQGVTERESDGVAERERERRHPVAQSPVERKYHNYNLHFRPFHPLMPLTTRLGLRAWARCAWAAGEGEEDGKRDGWVMLQECVKEREPGVEDEKSDGWVMPV